MPPALQRSCHLSLPVHLVHESRRRPWLRSLTRRPAAAAFDTPYSPQKTSAGGLKGKALEAAGGGARWDAIMEEAKPAGGLGFGGGGGGGSGEGPPPSSLRPLALHCAEQWSGRFRPECLEVMQKEFDRCSCRGWLRAKCPPFPYVRVRPVTRKKKEHQSLNGNCRRPANSPSQPPS